MVLSGALLLTDTVSEIVTVNDVKFISEAKKSKNEWGIAWKGNHFIIEHSGSSVEFERSVAYDELPVALQKEYDRFITVFHDIKIERVYKLNEPGHYEFYALKDNEIYKYKYKHF